MRSLKQFFSYLNEVDFPYVVMRNFDDLPDGVSKDHPDIDLLVYDQKHFEEIIPQAVRTHPFPRSRYKLNIDGFNSYLDVRYVGDNYYPRAFQINMLASREYDEKGFWKPDPVHFRIGLVYHAVHHKNRNDYEKYIGPIDIKEALISLQNSQISYVTPEDPTVGRFNQYWAGATSIVEKTDDGVVKQQKSFQDYDLIENEYRILSKITSRHFPKVEKGRRAGEIIIEDCGDRINAFNLPKDWKEQLIDILAQLTLYSVEHRDIKPDNLMLKDDVIKLIDFGWARFKSDPPDNPPGCLGYPYKPSWGWSDSFSMRKIIKEFEYKLEEECVS